MKFSVIGTGKTGGEVLKLLPPDEVVGSFSSKTPITQDILVASDAIIVFVPGDAMPALIPALLESKRPVVCGSTGFKWPEELKTQLARSNLTWITASNFSLGMNLLFHISRKLSRFSAHLPHSSFSIREVHHVHKKDKPSGTALTLKKMIDKPVEIEAIREGDVFGIHEVTLTSASETLSLKHAASNRSIFAAGAIAVARKLQTARLNPGLHFLEDRIDQLFPEVFGA